MDHGRAQRVRLLAGPRIAERVGLGPVALVDRGEQRLERQRHVGDDRVAHRRPRRLVGVAGDLDELGALGQQRPGDVGVVGEDRGADDEDQVAALERLGDRADRRRQHALEQWGGPREADPPAAGRRRREDRQLLALGERDRRVPAAAGVDVRAGDHHRVLRRREPLRQLGDLGGVGAGAAVDRALDRVLGLAVVGLGGPVVHRQRDEGRPFGGSEARWMPRASAATVSSARGGS